MLLGQPRLQRVLWVLISTVWLGRWDMLAALLRGFRGAPALDVDAVARIIATLGRLLLAQPAIREIDLNPVIIYPQGQGAVALDALMLVAPTHG